MDDLCRDLVKPIVEGPESAPEVESIDLTRDGERRRANNLDTPTPALYPGPQVPPLHGQTTGDNETDAVPNVPVKTDVLEVQVKTEDIPLALGTVPVKLEATDQENINPPIPSMPNSFSSETAPKIEENSQPGPSCIPPQPWEYVVVARDEEHAPIEDLLNCLVIEELQSLVKSLKVKCTSKKVGHCHQRNRPSH